jgi:hypothetical protein
MRFFRVNGLAIDEHKVRDNLFGRIIGRQRVFDYKMLHKLLTGEKKAAIVYNPAIQVSGLSEDHRRAIAHKEKINTKALSSLTAPKEAFSASANRNKRARKIAGGP